MHTVTSEAERHCLRCGDTLPDGVRYCVACGTSNFDLDAGRLATAQCEIKTHAAKRFRERITFWWRWMHGIRR